MFMRYVGADDLSIYLKCRHCKKVHPYETASLENREKKCDLCGAQYKMIFFRPVNIKSIIPWLPPIVMTLFFIIIMFLLSFPPLLRQFTFNRIVTTSNSLLTSIFIPIIGSVISFLPSLPSFAPSSFNFRRVISFLLVLLESLVLIFVMNNVIETNFNSLQIVNSDTNESQQYFGSVTGEYATGLGRLFDNRGNLVYYGHFSNNLYDGYGKKYEQLNAVHNNSSAQSYRCVYEGEFVAGKASGQGKEYRYDAEYTFEKENYESPYLYYQGEFLNGKYCGYGTLYGVKSKYEGSFFDGTYNGYGNKWYLDSNNSKIYRIEGYFNDGALNGQGTKYFPSGQVLFTGKYEDGSGISGTFYFESGATKYVGNVVDGNKYNGYGILYWENGNIRYDGEWSEHNRQGEGVNYLEDGTKEYNGSWYENKRTGYGIEYYSDGSSIHYAGRWNKNKWNGIGTEYYRNGKLLREGTWNNGKLNGSGAWYWENGTLRYEGNFSTGNQSGYGTSYYENGNKEYEGEWDNGHFSGEGAWYWSTGNLFFEGHFENGDIAGYGSTYTRDGILNYTGYFSDGKRNGTGTSYWPNGNEQYSGSWINSEYSGEGKEYSEDGKLLHEGTFFQGNFIP